MLSVSNCALVALFFTVTEAPGTTAPVGSATEPVNGAVEPTCAWLDRQFPPKTKTSKHNLVRIAFIGPPTSKVTTIYAFPAQTSSYCHYPLVSFSVVLCGQREQIPESQDGV